MPSYRSKRKSETVLLGFLPPALGWCAESVRTKGKSYVENLCSRDSTLYIANNGFCKVLDLETDTDFRSILIHISGLAGETMELTDTFNDGKPQPGTVFLAVSSAVVLAFFESIKNRIDK